MTKFNYSLNDDLTQEQGNRMPLMYDEIEFYKMKFKSIAENCNNIPEKNANDMASIECQFLKDYRLSSPQMKYIDDIYERYCER
jgi:hypothetical protein